jgi:SAM-dependent methyltransferase
MNNVATGGQIQIDPANTGQYRLWDGEHGAYWAEQADRYDRSNAPYHQVLLRAAAVRSGEYVLDVGCGTGQVAIDLVRTTPGSRALGADLSDEQLKVARERATGLDVEFVQADAQVHDFGDAKFDLVISRTGTMFFADQAAAFGNLARATRPGGRLVLMVWRGIEVNEWLRELGGAIAAGRDLPPMPPNAPGPLAQSDPEAVEAVLTAAGWADVMFTPLDHPIHFGADADDATTFLTGQFEFMLPPEGDPVRTQALANLHRVLEAHETPDGVFLGSGAWLITAHRINSTA